MKKQGRGGFTASAFFPFLLLVFVSVFVTLVSFVFIPPGSGPRLGPGSQTLGSGKTPGYYSTPIP